MFPVMSMFRIRLETRVKTTYVSISRHAAFLYLTKSGQIDQFVVQTVDFILWNNINYAHQMEGLCGITTSFPH